MSQLKADNTHEMPTRYEKKKENEKSTLSPDLRSSVGFNFSFTIVAVDSRYESGR